jgi:ribosomal protein L11 methylase PrmA
MLVLSGLLDRQAAGVEAVYRSYGFARHGLIRRAEWTTLVLRRP